MFHQKPLVSQEPLAPTTSDSTVVTSMINPSDPNTLFSQNHEPIYIPHAQFEQHPPQQSPQFIQVQAPQYIHHHPSTGLPTPIYIQIYPPQHQPYYISFVITPVPPIPSPWSSLPYNHPQTVPNYTMMGAPLNNHMRPAPSGNPEMRQVSVYTTPPGVGGSQMVHQIPTNQQFMNPNYVYANANIPNILNPTYGTSTDHASTSHGDA